MVSEHDIKDMWPDQQDIKKQYAAQEQQRQVYAPNTDFQRPGAIAGVGYAEHGPLPHEWAAHRAILDVEKTPTVNNVQIGGTHYKKYGSLQPWDVVLAWGLGYLDGTALKYIARHKDKGGKEDIKKAIHFLEKYLEVYDNI